MSASKASDLALIVGMVRRTQVYFTPAAGNALARAENAAQAAEAIDTALRHALRAGITSNPQEPGFAADLEAMREKILDEMEAILAFGDDAEDYPVEIETVTVSGSDERAFCLGADTIGTGDTAELPLAVARALSGRGKAILHKKN